MVPVNEDLGVARFLADRVRRGEPAALLTVAEELGSAPGAPGFKMGVGADGALCGTVGGGDVEHRLVEDARALLRAPPEPGRARTFIHHPGTGSGDEPSGMICGGGQTVLVRICRGGDLPALDAWSRGDRGCLIIEPGGLRFEPGAHRPAAVRFERRGDGWIYEEIVGVWDTVHIVGGGHVGRALARLLAGLNFRVDVIDPRPEAAAELAGTPGVVCRARPYAEGAAEIPGGDDRYVVIVTPGHAADYEALRAVIRKPLRYLALVGSAGKARVLRERMAQDGIEPSRGDRLRVPAGLPIGSRTAAEIAVSIAAEIIACRHQGD